MWDFLQLLLAALPSRREKPYHLPYSVLRNIVYAREISDISEYPGKEEFFKRSYGFEIGLKKEEDAVEFYF